jgi:hypothetical protein
MINNVISIAARLCVPCAIVLKIKPRTKDQVLGVLGTHKRNYDVRRSDNKRKLLL